MEQILENFYFESFAEPILIHFYPFFQPSHWPRLLTNQRPSSYWPIRDQEFKIRFLRLGWLYAGFSCLTAPAACAYDISPLAFSFSIHSSRDRPPSPLFSFRHSPGYLSVFFLKRWFGFWVACPVNKTVTYSVSTSSHALSECGSLISCDSRSANDWRPIVFPAFWLVDWFVCVGGAGGISSQTSTHESRDVCL